MDRRQETKQWSETADGNEPEATWPVAMRWDPIQVSSLLRSTVHLSEVGKPMLTPGDLILC